MSEIARAPSLPEILPVFPLTGVLLLPGTILPLHIFEPRYRNMVEDALNGEKIFGMIQPVIPQEDNRPLPGGEKESPELYSVGCAGRIEKCQRLPDGRYTLQLMGMNRFRSEGELSIHRGYRRVKADYSAFSDSATDGTWRCNRAVLIESLKGYARTQGLDLSLKQVGRLTDVEFVNLLGVSLPFHPTEKQALLEAPSLKDREEVLVNLLRLGAAASSSGADGSDMPGRTLN